jgi:hypothetical protein
MRDRTIRTPESIVPVDDHFPAMETLFDDHFSPLESSEIRDAHHRKTHKSNAAHIVQERE